MSRITSEICDDAAAGAHSAAAAAAAHHHVAAAVLVVVAVAVAVAVVAVAGDAVVDAQDDLDPVPVGVVVAGLVHVRQLRLGGLFNE